MQEVGDLTPTGGGTGSGASQGQSEGGGRSDKHIDSEAAKEIDYEYRQDDGQDYVDRSVIDSDPKDGLFSGTARRDE